MHESISPAISKYQDSLGPMVLNGNRCKSRKTLNSKPPTIGKIDSPTRSWNLSEVLNTATPLNTWEQYESIFSTRKTWVNSRSDQTLGLAEGQNSTPLHYRIDNLSNLSGISMATLRKTWSIKKGFPQRRSPWYQLYQMQLFIVRRS